jgi:hypothetical protein
VPARPAKRSGRYGSGFAFDFAALVFFPVFADAAVDFAAGAVDFAGGVVDFAGGVADFAGAGVAGPGGVVCAGGVAGAEAASVGCGAVCAHTPVVTSDPTSNSANFVRRSTGALLARGRGFVTDPLGVALIDLADKIRDRVIGFPVFAAAVRVNAALRKLNSIVGGLLPVRFACDAAHRT